MNKKFLSAVLFGALMVSSTGTFVSCKDYDDDINNLQTQITANADAIKALQDLVGQGNWVTSVAGIENGIRVTMSNGTSTDILGINGEDGTDGRDGTVVTIVDGYWAFDGVKSEYPATPSESSDGQDAHEIKISEDGYWMIWNAETGEYETTSYSVAPISATQNTNGSWTISIKNADGTIDSIVIPATALAHIEVINLNDRDDFNVISMDYNYGIVRAEKKWGWSADKTMGAGLYSKLGTDMTLLLNPAGVHGDAYDYTLKNSKGTEAPVKFFDTAVPYEGAPLARTTSDNALWTLPAYITVSEASQIETLRRNLYLNFKYNDSKYYDLAVVATSKDNGAKVVSNYVSQVELASVTGKEELNIMSAQECLIGEAYYPEFTGAAAGKIYDYELRLSQDAENLKRAAVYGATVTDDGHAWIATEQAGVYNPIQYDITYILLDGTEHQLKLTDKTSAYVTVNFTTEQTSFNDPWTLEDPTLYQGAPLNATYNKDRGVFEYKTKEYDLTAKVNELSEIQKLVWNQAVDQYNKGYKNAFSVNLIGGDGENNVANNNSIVENNISYTIKDNKIQFTFSVSDTYYANFMLDKAYEYTITVVDPDNHGAGVAKIVLPFEFTQPEIDKVGIVPQNGLFTQWKSDEKAGDTLYSFGAYNDGAYNDSEMKLPLYEAFNMWIAKDSDKYNAKNPNAQYYQLTVNYPLFDMPEVTFIGGNVNVAHMLSDLLYESDWTKYNTSAKQNGAVMRRALNDNSEAEVFVDVAYKFYGVYDALPEQLPFYTDGTDKYPGFRLVFASTIQKATLKTKKDVYEANANSNDVFISNDEVVATTMLGKEFVLFNGLKDNKVYDRASLNNERGFNESQRPFAQPIAYEVEAKYVNSVGTSIITTAATVDCTNTPAATLWSEDARGNRSYVLPAATDDTEVKVYLIPSISEERDDNATPSIFKSAHTSGFAIQLGNKIEDRQPVEVSIKIKDALGFYNVLKVKVQKLQ